MSNIVIDILAEFTGKKAFKQADTATQKLSGSAAKLGGALATAFSARAVIQYAKAAAMAAAQDQQAQAILSTNLKNLGLAYANVDSEKFIGNLERQTAILDDELRPAYAKLARTTGSIGKTQKIMTAAFDASVGSGQSYSAVIETLSQAYVGNQKGLKKLNLGLTTAQLSAMSFDEVLTAITDHFNKVGTESLKGYAGQMAKLDVASKNSAETIGGALLDSFAHLAGNGDIDRATSKIDTFSKGLADMIRYMSGSKNIADAFNGVDFHLLGGSLITNKKRYGGATGAAGAMAAQTAAKKAEEAAIARAKRLAAIAKAAAAAELARAKAKKDALALDKAALALGKGEDVFNLEAIQLNAAMINSAEKLGKVTTTAQLLAITNDIARLKVKQDMLALEDAIASGDAAAATAAAKKLNADLAILGTLSNQALKLANIKSILESLLPKNLIDLANLNDAIDKIKELIRLAGLPVVPKIEDKPKVIVPPVKVVPDFPTLPSGEEWPGFINLTPDSAGDITNSSNSSPTIVFNAPIYTISDAEFAANVQKAIQNNKRFGNNLDYAGAF